MSYFNKPMHLEVTFLDGKPPIKKTYSQGASHAVGNMMTAMLYYRDKGVHCFVSLYTDEMALINKQEVIPEKKDDQPQLIVPIQKSG